MEDWENEFSRILLKMTLRKDSEAFREPVNWVELNLPDYPSIIKHPMDLKTIQYNMEEGKYNSPEEAANDMRLIFMNAMTYNAPGSKVYSQAKSLSEYFETNWGIYSKHDINRPPLNDEMTEWAEKCHRITPENLGKLLKMLDEKCPNCLVKRPEANDVEVNVDLIPGKVFREVNDFVNGFFPDLSSLSRRTIVSAPPTPKNTLVTIKK